MPSKYYKPLSLVTLFAALLVVVVLILTLQKLGPYEDETLFVTPYFNRDFHTYKAWIFGEKIPLMIMPYLGTLKTWLYAPLLANLNPSLELLRLPCVFLVMGSIYFYSRATAGFTRRPLDFFLIAWLLLSDSEYLIVNLFDWGPVAIHHFLFSICLWLISGPAMLESRPNIRFLLFGFLSGLVLWNKANSIWVMAPLYGLIMIAGVYTNGLRTTTQRGGLALLGFSIGALAFIKSIAAAQGTQEISALVHLDIESLGKKLNALLLTLDHQSLLHWFVTDFSPSRLPLYFLGWIATALILLALNGILSGQHRLLAGIAAVTLVTAWLQMALGQNSGGSMHHIVLLWPLHYFLIVTGLSNQHVRIGAVAILVLLSGYQSVYTFDAIAIARPSNYWSPASKTLAQKLTALEPSRLFLNDWGISNNLMFWSKGKLRGGSAAEVFWSESLNEESRKKLKENMLNPSAVHVSFMPGYRTFGMIEKEMAQIADEQQLQWTTIEMIQDGWGKPIFEIYRFTPLP